MYTMIIADDEAELREALVQTVDWESIGFRVVGEAENGVEALELVEKLNPDLLLTDIKMPFLSGIDLARSAREISPAMNIAFISGFDDFEYAKQAIQYNIISYILKPVSANELREEMLKIREKMDARVNELKHYRSPHDFDKLNLEYRSKLFLYSMLMEDNNDLDERAYDNGLRKNHEEPTHYIIQTVNVYDDEGNNVTDDRYITLVNSILGKYVHSISIFTNGSIITIAAQMERELKRYMALFPKEICQTVAKIFGYDTKVGVSNVYEDLTRTRLAYYEAVDAHDYMEHEKNGIVYISDHERKIAEKQIHVTDTIDDLLRILKTEDEDKLCEFIDKIYLEGELDHGLLGSELMVAIYETIKGFTSVDEAERLVDTVFNKDEQMARIMKKRSKEDLKEFATMAKRIIVEQRKTNSQAICEEVVSIIDSEYGDETLSLTVISDRLHLTPSYLSSLIKKGKGESFINLLTAKRMEVAREAIMYSTKKILEIALECGFSDNHYFSYSFKKYYGVSPKKMREDLKRGNV